MNHACSSRLPACVQPLNIPDNAHRTSLKSTMHTKAFRALPLAIFLLTVGLHGQLPIEPGNPVNYAKIAFRPEEWTKQNLNPLLIPWLGENIVFLAQPQEFDGKLMSRWVQRLDEGWRLYTELTGESPKPHKQLAGLPTIAAVPNSSVTCGVGCGFVGATGIELAKFYSDDWPTLVRDPDSMPHYAFYEMGRNFYTFGDRHSCFTTGFAVFMRYVCMDTLRCNDTDSATRRIIEDIESHIKASPLSFLQIFTNAADLSEKLPRIKQPNGTHLHPSDQPVTYASAMLRLRRELGGNDWLKRFFRLLAECPTAPKNTADGALSQSWNWYLCASLAAQRDLSTIFCDEWKLPLSQQTRNQLRSLDWTKPNTRIADLQKKISPLWASN